MAFVATQALFLAEACPFKHHMPVMYVPICRVHTTVCSTLSGVTVI